MKWIYQWKGLSEYLGNVPIRTLKYWESEGLLKKHKIGKKVLFKKEEIDNLPIPVER